MGWIYALCSSGYTSIFHVRQFRIAITIIIDAGLVCRCLKALLDMQSADETEMPALKKKIKNYIRAGIILTCLPSLVDIMAGYYNK